MPYCQKITPFQKTNHFQKYTYFDKIAPIFKITHFQSFNLGFKILTQVQIVKGIVHQFFFYRSNLIFWIVMGCGIGDFARRGLKTPQNQDFRGFILSPGTSTCSAMGP